MNREHLIEEYKRLYASREERRNEIDVLRERIRLLNEVDEFDRRWMDSIEERFDGLYGCNSDNDNVKWHLHCYVERGEEVPE